MMLAWRGLLLQPSLRPYYGIRQYPDLRRDITPPSDEACPQAIEGRRIEEKEVKREKNRRAPLTH